MLCKTCPICSQNVDKWKWHGKVVWQSWSTARLKRCRVDNLQSLKNCSSRRLKLNKCSVVDISSLILTVVRTHFLDVDTTPTSVMKHEMSKTYLFAPKKRKRNAIFSIKVKFQFRLENLRNIGISKFQVFLGFETHFNA